MSITQHIPSQEAMREVIITPNADGQLVVAEPDLLFGAEFQRAGRDLLLVNDDAPTMRVPDYFSTQEPADVFSANGSMLRGSTVETLAGPLAPGQYAQVGASAGSVGPIGQVETVDGSASVQRSDGIVETLNVGMKIFQNDVVQTGDAGSLSVTFVDGTIFTLSANSRMLIDELIYDPDGSQNTGTFDLIQGGFVFIAGQVAKTGGMEVKTPSATMGIRGTTVLVSVETVGGEIISEVSLTRDPDGAVGEIELRNANGDVVANVTDTDSTWILTTLNGEVRQEARTLADDAEDNLLIAEVIDAYRTAFARVEAGDTFVSLDSASSSTPNGAPTDAPTDTLELDSIDEPLGIENAPELEKETGDEGSTFDEGNLIIPDFDAPTVTVAGLEDSGPSQPITGAVSISADVGQTLSFSLAGQAANGVAQVNADGSFTFVPAPDFNGTDRFSYRVTDGETLDEIGFVTVQVLPVNDAPVLRDAQATVAEDGSLNGALEATDIDGDVLIFALNTAPANGSVVLRPDGTYTYTPAPDFSGTESFSVSVTDAENVTNVATITVVVSASNDAPRITTPTGQDAGRVTEGAEQSSASGQLTAIDPDGGPAPQWSGSGNGSFGRFEIAADGSWTYVLNNTTADSLSAGAFATETFVATASDPLGATQTQQVTVTIVGTNDAPVVSRSANIEVIQDTSFSGALTATDVDSIGALTFSAGPNGPTNGALTINPAGTYTYVPAAGFAGLDGFEFVVTDSDGGRTTGEVTIEVESPGQTPNSVAVVGISTQATVNAPAGNVSFESFSVSPASLNLAIVLDRSSSIGANGWNTQVNTVATAIEDLAAQYVNSSTSVAIEVITFATNATSIGPFDVANPTLPATVRALPFSGGLTNWDLALNAAENFFDTQSSTASNLVLFTTDGAPTSGAWVQALADLTDAQANGYTVTIEAFGIGSNVDLNTLALLDSSPTLLNSPADLAGSLANTQLFNPQFVDFQLTLQADGVDMGVIADETHPSLVQQGLKYDLPIAEIAGIETLLGETNRFSATVRYDLDGNTSTAELVLFTSELLVPATTAQVLTGLNDSDLLLGGDLGDDIQGAGGADVLLGLDGDDTIDGGSGRDVVMGGDGDDTLVVSDASGLSGETLDGGAGTDTVQFDLAGDLSVSIVPSLNLTNIEAIDMSNGLSNDLTLAFADIVDLSSDANAELETLLNAALGDSAIILGDAGDTLTLAPAGPGVFQAASIGSVQDTDGNTLDVYEYVQGGNVLATLGVDDDVVVNIPVA